VCPECASDLSLGIFNKNEEEIIDGVFRCKNCSNYYFVINYIPRFLPINLISKSSTFINFFQIYSKKLGKLNIQFDKCQNNSLSEDYQIRSKTIEYFGYEWDRFINWGWIKEDEILIKDRIKYEGGFISNTINAFKTKSLINEDDLTNGKLILDAGCGNGRFSNQAAKYDGEVIGVDIGTGAVEAAYKNTRERKNIHIIQGDLFKLPFKNGVFNTAFSIGVLMHTGDAPKTFETISRHIKVGGVFTAHVYQKLNPIWEINDRLIRMITTKMSVKSNIYFANFMAKIGRLVSKMGLFNTVNLFLRVQPTLIHMYDWYSAPVASHHTYEEVNRWFFKNNFEIIGTKESESDRKFRRPWSVTVKGKKRNN
jgi:ubiquinone/menaquinone biosynthesis C-methylase UbiE/uncharacterized protein YbaR (Trm112 family)